VPSIGVPVLSIHGGVRVIDMPVLDIL